ncbi:uncharacterized protein [Diadema setosum]|uniref:uncharacterized protein isoform X1 n=2 Tax=Diadema setosum TaxID=31175 RepID=UPI003B3B4B0A
MEAPVCPVESSNISGNACKKMKKSATGKKSGKRRKHFICSICSMEFSYASNLHRHLKNIHKKKEICLVDGCTYQCSNKRKMLLHLELKHTPHVEKVDLQFPNLEEFYAWKLKEEVQNFVCFTKRRGDTEMLASTHQHYICYLSRRKSAKEKLAKMDLFCPARIVVKQSRETGTVSATYFKTHSHPLTYSGTQHLPIPECLRHDIKKKLKAGQTVNQVHLQLKRDHQSQLAVAIAMYNRLRKVDKTQIRSIQRSMVRSGVISDKTSDKANEEDASQMVCGAEHQVIPDTAMHLEVTTDQSISKDLMLNSTQKVAATSAMTPVEIISPDEVTKHISAAQRVDQGDGKPKTDVQVMVKQLLTLLENEGVKHRMMSCVEGSIEELIVMCKVAQT